MSVQFLVWDDTTKEVGYATTIPASRISDLSVIVPAFYSETNDLSDVVSHARSGSGTLFDISAPTELLGGVVSGGYGACNPTVSYTIDGASTVSRGGQHRKDAPTSEYNGIAYIVPIKADVSLKVSISGCGWLATHAFTKCPFLDEKKPNILLDIDKKTGEIRVIHEAQRVIDASMYNPAEGCKHVHLVGEYEIDQLPKGVPFRYIRYKNGKFERTKWYYIFRKDINVLGQTFLEREWHFEFDRELSQEEIAQIEEKLGAKFVKVI